MQVKTLQLIENEATQSRIGGVQCIKLSQLAQRIITRTAIELLVCAEE